MKLAFFFDYASPFAYLGATQVEAVAGRHGAALEWRPFLLGALFKAIGTPNVPLLAMPAAKQAWVRRDLARWATHWGVDFRFPSRFPMNTVTALRMTLLVPDQARGPLVHAFFRHYWVDDGDLRDEAALARLANDAGFDGVALLARAREPEAKALLFEATSAAEGAGVCGAPTFGVGDMLFWGQDRLALVERALGGWRPRCG